MAPRVTILAFAVGAFWLFYVYCGYPFCLWLLSLVRGIHPKVDPNCHPTVSVLISARNEERDIAWKVQ